MKRESQTFIRQAASFATLFAALVTLSMAEAADQNPTLVGSLDIPQPVARITVSGTRAYVTSGPDSTTGSMGALHIADVANPAQPILLGTLELTRPAWRVAVAGDYAYVADESAGLIVVNVSEPSSPVLVGAYNTSESAYDVFLSGNHAYVADGQAGLVVIDVSDPADPHRVGGLDASEEVQQVVVSGNYAFLADRYWSGTEMQPYGALRIMDVSNPASPKLVGKHRTGGQAWHLAVAGNLAYVGADALEVFDVSDPVNPRRIGSYGTGGAVVVEGNRAFVANFQSGLHVLDISDPTTPRRLGGAQCSGYPRSIAAADRHAYVSAQTYNSDATGAGLQIFDVSLPVEEPLPPLSVALSGKKVVISWPSSVVGAVLEATDHITPASNWTTESTTPTVVGDQSIVTLETGSGTKFFRLKKP